MVDSQHYVDPFMDVIEQYERDQLGELAQGYPHDKRSLWIDYADVVSYDPALADDFMESPRDVLKGAEAALGKIDLPVDVDLSKCSVRVHNVEETYTYTPGEIRKDHAGKFVGVTGTLERVTTPDDVAEEVVFRCRSCGGYNPYPQDPAKGELRQPDQCGSCEKRATMDVVEDQGEWSDYTKVRIQSPPNAGDSESGKLVGYVMNDLIDYGGDHGILGRAGEKVTVNGFVRRVQKDGDNELLFTNVLEVNSIEYEKDNDAVDVAAHREEFEALADRDDAVDLIAESLAPNLHTTPSWDAAMEFAVAYLFGAPPINIPSGPTYRGDLHFLMITDFGMGKSTFKQDIQAFSPNCISKSTTALSSGVGLTAAATKDDFGEGQWTITPGLLVRANGGHLILDEIDKGPEELTDMNDALEGEQVVDVEKAGKSATYESKTGLMALGNPIEGRFDPNQSVSQQMGIDETLLSRFDGIVTMFDEADKEQDSKVAETYGRAYTEAQEAQYGEREEFDQLERPVPVEVGRAWIKHAKENVFPILRYEQFEELEEWYAEDLGGV